MDPNNQPGQARLPQDQPGGALPSLPQDPGLPPAPAQPGATPAMPGDPTLGQAPAPMPADPSLTPQTPVPAPTDPNLTNTGMAVPPSMAGNPELATGGGAGGSKKALGFVFVIGGVLALIVIVVIALRML